MLILQENYFQRVKTDCKLSFRASASSSVCFFTEARDFAFSNISLVFALVLSWLTTVFFLRSVSCICCSAAYRRSASSSSRLCSACRLASMGSMVIVRVLFSKLLSPPLRLRLLRLRSVFLFAIIYSIYILFIGHHVFAPI
jgi:hypothetical protein